MYVLFQNKNKKYQVREKVVQFSVYDECFILHDRLLSAAPILMLASGRVAHSGKMNDCHLFF